MIKLFKTTVIALFVFIFHFNLNGDEIQKQLEKLREELKVPGINLAIVMPEGKVLKYSTGYSWPVIKTLMKPETRIFSGSIGKTRVSAIMLQLVSEGKVELDEKISKYIGHCKWFRRLPNSDKITVRMLMNHTSGIPEHIMVEKFNKSIIKTPDRIWEPSELISYVLDKKPLFEAGNGWSYADTNYIVVGLIINTVTGNKYNELLKTRLLKPLKLINTTPSESRDIKLLAQGYTGKEPFNFPEKVVINGRYVVNPQFEWTGGGVITNAPELAQWGKILYSGKLLSKNMMMELLKPVSTETGKNSSTGYGLGVEVWSSPYGKIYGHTGTFPGYQSLLKYYKDWDFSIAIQLNEDRTHNSSLKGLSRISDVFIPFIVKRIKEKTE